LLGSYSHFQLCYHAALRFEPAIILGFGIDAGVTAARLRKPCIVFTDNDHTWFQNWLTAVSGATIVTPDCYHGNLGKKHIRISAYKELTYLHPNHFYPDPGVLNDLGVARDEKYVILRFNVLDAVHDIIASYGFSVTEQIKLANELSQYARVFVSPEARLPHELERYQLNIPYDKFHHALFYASLFVGDTGTTASEAAVLGTPSIMFHRKTKDIGNFADLKRYGLMEYYYENAEIAIQKAITLIQRPELKEEWALKRSAMLKDKVDIVNYLVNMVEHNDPTFTRSYQGTGFQEIPKHRNG
jgi:predicted glycosyltransferase